VRRGDVFQLRLGRSPGHEQSRCPLRRHRAVRRSAATVDVLLAPTSSAARAASFRPEIEIGGPSTRVLVEQTGAIDISRLGDHHGHLTPEELWGVDLALETVFDLQ
jgi:mRNA interferase MazF